MRRMMVRFALLVVAVCCAVTGIALADPYNPYADGKAALLKGDYATALKIWRPMAERGDPAGENGLGYLYNCGCGVPQDIDKAIEWYRRAIDQGFIKAEYNLGVLHASARWGRADPAEALHWLREAAQHGFGPADFELGEIYHDGRGVPRDAAKALAYYRVAAAQQFAQAQDVIGYMYAGGDGVKQDRVAAYAWFALAAANTDDPGHQMAKGDLMWIRGQLSLAEIDVAQKRANRCRESAFTDCP